MERVTATIKCGNDAFSENCASEVARLLREAAKRIENGDLDRLGYIPLMDANGNKVGEVNAE